jgi:hypothetical protein
MKFPEWAGKRTFYKWQCLLITYKVQHIVLQNRHRINTLTDLLWIKRWQNAIII